MNVDNGVVAQPEVANTIPDTNINDGSFSALEKTGDGQYHDQWSKGIYAS